MTYPNNYQYAYPQPNYNFALSPQQRLAQMEQQYPQFAPQQAAQAQMLVAGLNGRIVDDFSQVTADMVPMDAVGAFFIKRDNSEIQRRAWGNMGNIEITAYKPDTAALNASSANSTIDTEKLKIGLSEDVTELLSEKFSGLEKQIEDLKKSLGKSTRAKREADSE